jgi:membrane associated rhomboid family serine protease
MARCEVCGEGVDMPYVCNRCGNTYCGEHRLPEKHDCVGLGDWNDPAGVFESESAAGGTEATARAARTGGVGDRLPIDTGPGGALAYFRGNMTFLFLALMVGTFLTQVITRGLLPRDVWAAVFVISPQHPEYVWTWVTSVFAHGGFGHLFSNAIVIFFFGRLVERYVGSRDYTLLFLGAGVLAGLTQIAATAAAGGTGGALGASGAALAIMGTLTVLNPGLRVYLYFILPVPIWLLTGGYALLTVFAINTGGAGAGGVAQFAHLAGLVIGLAYGVYAKRRGVGAPERLEFGGGGMRRGPGGPGGRGPL